MKVNVKSTDESLWCTRELGNRKSFYDCRVLSTRTRTPVGEDVLESVRDVESTGFIVSRTIIDDVMNEEKLVVTPAFTDMKCTFTKLKGMESGRIKCSQDLQKALEMVK